jgi:hypothetical protein
LGVFGAESSFSTTLINAIIRKVVILSGGFGRNGLLLSCPCGCHLISASRRPISLNPQSAQSYTLYTHFLAGMGIARDTLFQNFVYEQSLKRGRA